MCNIDWFNDWSYFFRKYNKVSTNSTNQDIYLLTSSRRNIHDTKFIQLQGLSDETLILKNHTYPFYDVLRVKRICRVFVPSKLQISNKWKVYFFLHWSHFSEIFPFIWRTLTINHFMIYRVAKFHRYCVGIELICLTAYRILFPICFEIAQHKLNDT